MTEGAAGLLALIGALALFVLAHLIPAVPAVRGRLVAAVGRTPYLIAYSALSLGLIWLVWRAYRAAPYIELWPPLPVLRWTPLIAMAVACVLIAAGLRTPNPFSLGRGATGYDPARPGVLRLTRHPLLWALGLWALGHIPANGDLAGVIFFSTFAALAMAGIPVLDRRKRARLGPEWESLAARTGKARLGLRDIDLYTVLAAALLYALLLRAHLPVIGVWPGPV